MLAQQVQQHAALQAHLNRSDEAHKLLTQRVTAGELAHGMLRTDLQNAFHKVGDDIQNARGYAEGVGDVTTDHAVHLHEARNWADNINN
eukprot:39744-Eustigmatos_ZCMA.PRE.1